MLVIQTDQRDSMRGALRRQFHARIRDFLKRCCPTYIEDIDDSTLMNEIAEVDAAATSYRIRTERGITQFAVFSFIVSKDFHCVPEVNRFLRSGPQTADWRINWLLEEVVARKKAEAANQVVANKALKTLTLLACATIVHYFLTQEYQALFLALTIPWGVGIAAGGAAAGGIESSTAGGAPAGPWGMVAVGVLAIVVGVGVGIWAMAAASDESEAVPDTEAPTEAEDCAESAAPVIPLSPEREVHILDGDETGGGHGPGRGTPGKSEFPNSLSDAEVLQGIRDIANNPANYPGGTIPTSGPRIGVRGEINGVPTQVIVEPGGEGVITAWPIGVPRNP